MAPRKFIRKSEKRRAPEGQAPMTAKNPLGLKEERGFRVTKTGKKKAVDRAAAKPRANIKNEPNWIEYHALKERPQGMTSFEKDENSNILVKHGELYCRVQLKTGELCHETIRYSDINNLKKHIERVHDLTVLDCKHRGTKTRAEVTEAAKWCGQVMVTHKESVIKQKAELERMMAKKAEENAKKAREEESEKAFAGVADKLTTFKQITSKKGEIAEGRNATSAGNRGGNSAKASQTQAGESKDDRHSDSGIRHDDSGIGMLSDYMELDDDLEEVIQPTEAFAIIE